MAVLPGQPGRLVPMVTPASDLPSLLQAVNTAAKIIQVLGGPGPQPNNVYQQSATVSSVASNSATGGNGNIPRPAAALPIAMNNSNSVNGGAAVLVPSTWREESRATRQVTIYHHDFQTAADDKTQRLFVTRIDQLGFSPDTSSTEQAQIWKYGKPDPRQLPSVAQPTYVCGPTGATGPAPPVSVFNRVDLSLQGTVHIPTGSAVYGVGLVSATTSFPGAEGPFPLTFWNTAIGIPDSSTGGQFVLPRGIGNIYVNYAANFEPNVDSGPVDWIFRIEIVQSSSSAAELLDGLTNISLTITIEGEPVGDIPLGPYTPTASTASIVLGTGADVGFTATGTTGFRTTTASFVIDWTSSTQATNQSSVTLTTS